MTSVEKKWIRTKADETAVSSGYYFDEESGERVINFIETFCTPSQGDLAGEPLRLMEWQKDFILRLFGWKRRNGLRRFTTAYLEIGKGNGKTTFLAALMAYMCVADGENGADCVAAAVDRDQASLLFDETRKMIERSEELAPLAKVVDHRKTITFPSLGSRMRAISADAHKNEGGNWSFSVIDELHMHKSRLLYDVIDNAGAKRSQPLRVAITTAGEDETGPWFEERTLSENIINGIDSENLTHLGVVYRADPEDDPSAPETWRKANPSMGYNLSEDSLREQWERSKDFPLKVSHFRRVRTNVITAEVSAFLRIEKWNANADPSIDIRWFDKCPCWLGLDLAAKTDLTALAVIFERSGEIYVFPYFWLPEDRLAIGEKEDRVPYQSWKDQGFLNVTDGARTDYDAIKEKILELSLKHPIVSLGADPWNAAQFLNDLQKLKIKVQEVNQNLAVLSEPTKLLESMVVDGKLNHDGNPILTWNVKNAAALRDGNDNVRLQKNKSRGRIDGLAALVNALAVKIDPKNEVRRSIYETRGLRFV